jgi:hypothetical protein
MTRRNERVRAAVILASGAAALLAVGTELPTPVRATLVFWFVCACPGLAWTTVLRLHEPLSEFTLGIAFSLVVATLASEALALLRLWSPAAILVCLVVIAVPPCVLPFVTSRSSGALEGPA